MPGSAIHLPDGVIHTVGPRIPTPDEPWQTVPKYEPTEEMLFKAECEAKSKEVDMSSPTPTEHPDDGRCLTCGGVVTEIETFTPGRAWAREIEEAGNDARS